MIATGWTDAVNTAAETAVTARAPEAGTLTGSGAVSASAQSASGGPRGACSGALAGLVAGLGLVSALTFSAPVQAQDIKGDAEAAKDKISMCTGCHAIPGYKASFPRVHHVPLIGGQSEAYLANALIAYRKGDRDHPTMRSIAGSLSDQDIADLAAFYSQAK